MANVNLQCLKVSTFVTVVSCDFQFVLAELTGYGRIRYLLIKVKWIFSYSSSV